MIKLNNLFVAIIVITFGCNTNKAKKISVVKYQSNCDLVFVLEKVLISLPTESVIQFSDSLCNDGIISDYCFFSAYFSSKDFSIITLNDDATEKELYLFLKEKYDDSLLFETYEDFDYLYFSYCRLIIGKYLSTGNVKLFNKLTNEYVYEYQVVRVKDENGGITDCYYLPDNNLFYEDVISIGL
jgi:hypothetical protein